MKNTLIIDPAYRDSLADAGLRDFDDFLSVRAAGAATSKHKTRETVPLEITIDGAPRRFFLKRVFKVPPAHAIAPLLKGRRPFSQPWLEWQALGRLAEANIPAMKRVAVGERRVMGCPKAAFLLVEAVPAEHTLEEWLVPGFPRPATLLSHRLRHQLFYDLGHLIHDLHAAGFDWPDISVKHIFAIPPDADGHWQFWLIDVERMTRRPERPRINDEIGEIKLINLLSRFSASAAPRALSKIEFLAFLGGFWTKSAYFDQRQRWRKLRFGFNHYIGVIDELDVATAPRLPDNFEHPRSDTMVRRSGVMMSRRHGPALQSARLDTIEGVFAYADGQLLDKPGLSPHRRRIRAKIGNADAPRVVYIKRFTRPPFAEQLRRIREFRPSAGTALREAFYAKRLTQLGVPTIHCVAAGHRMSGIWERQSFCIMDEVPGESLERLAARAATDPVARPTWPDRKEIIRQLSRITARLHANGLFHRDFYLSHLFLARNADGGIVVSVIDLARMIVRRRRPDRWIVKDLAALEYSSPAPLVTRADRMRFLYDYHRIVYRNADRAAIRALAESVRSRAGRMQHHDAHRAARQKATAS